MAMFKKNCDKCKMDLEDTQVALATCQANSKAQGGLFRDPIFLGLVGALLLTGGIAIGTNLGR